MKSPIPAIFSTLLFYEKSRVAYRAFLDALIKFKFYWVTFSCVAFDLALVRPYSSVTTTQDTSRSIFRTLHFAPLLFFRTSSPSTVASVSSVSNATTTCLWDLSSRNHTPPLKTTSPPRSWTQWRQRRERGDATAPSRGKRPHQRRSPTCSAYACSAGTLAMIGGCARACFSISLFRVWPLYPWAVTFIKWQTIIRHQLVQIFLAKKLSFN